MAVATMHWQKQLQVLAEFQVWSLKRFCEMQPFTQCKLSPALWRKIYYTVAFTFVFTLMRFDGKQIGRRFLQISSISFSYLFSLNYFFQRKIIFHSWGCQTWWRWGLAACWRSAPSRLGDGATPFSLSGDLKRRKMTPHFKILSVQ